MFVTRRRYGHEHPCRLVAGVADVVRHARRNEQVRSGLGADQLAAHLPLALALQHVEGFFLNTMNVEAGEKAGWQRPIEHGRALRVLSSHEERHRLACQGDFLAFTRHSNDCFCAHCAPPWFGASSTAATRSRGARRSLIPPKMLQNVPKWWPLSQWRRSTNLARSASTGMIG